MNLGPLGIQLDFGRRHLLAQADPSAVEFTAPGCQRLEQLGGSVRRRCGAGVQLGRTGHGLPLSLCRGLQLREAPRRGILGFEV